MIILSHCYFIPLRHGRIIQTWALRQDMGTSSRRTPGHNAHVKQRYPATSGKSSSPRRRLFPHRSASIPKPTQSTLQFEPLPVPVHAPTSWFQNIAAALLTNNPYTDSSRSHLPSRPTPRSKRKGVVGHARR
ncbi:uncharacterized protein CLUP02_10241 [Colletotrichum lupini]|uniref:Uncharacterized protein n=1 Tax=Colletotrichum lupini TaxID=145971 RepID=A0A9Q8SX61_9PEZI|nr:uncharacterized protein CLUP02_10241 [Colletotrichum lupini]UQC84745.1 hypothetical protein CLUP02_10241 [Colletotrichum lupini]